MLKSAATCVFALLIPCLFIQLSFAQQWAARSSSSFTNEAYDMVSDANGNSYICGYISGETSFAPSITFPSAAGNGDIFIAKYNAQGQPQWIKKYGGNYADRAVAIALSPNNDILVTGQYFGTMNVGSTSLSSASNSKDIFIIKLDNNGNEIWALSQGGSLEDNAYDIACDHQGNVLLSGQFKGNVTIAGQAAVSSTDSNTGLPSNDLFIAKYSANGTGLWLQAGHANYDDRGLALGVDQNNNVFFSGQFSEDLNFAGTTISNTAYNIGFLAKLAPNGSLIWMNKLQAGFCRVYDLVVNSTDDVFITGDFLGSLLYNQNGTISTTTNTHSKKVFVIKANSAGNFQWSNTLGSDNYISSRALAVNSQDEVFIAGNFECSLSQLNTPNAHFLSVGFRDIYLWALNPSGTLNYTRQIGGQLMDEVHGMDLIASEPVVCGGYTQNLNFPFPTLAINTPVHSPPNLNNFNLHDYYSEPYYYLPGDETRNFFVTNYLNDKLNNYKFYYDQFGLPSDTVETHFVTDPATWNLNIDTVSYCNDTILRINTRTYWYSGPSYNYLWNTGDTLHEIWVNSTGDYGLEYERRDGCSSYSDSIFFIRNIKPNLPLISDSDWIASQQAPPYPVYELCQDSIDVWFNGLCSNCSISISEGLSTLYTDSLAHTYHDGNYLVQVSDGTCSNAAGFVVEVSDSLDYSIWIEPNLMLHDTIDYNDSLAVCANEVFVVELHDNLLNPSGQYFDVLPYPVAETIVWTVVSPSGAVENHYYDTLTPYPLLMHHLPDSTGWYQVTCHIVFGGMNTCNVDTIHFIHTDSFFIEVLPLPIANTQLSLSNIICPGGSAYVIANPPLPNGTWVGPVNNSISWSSQLGDSALIHEEGNYYYEALISDSITGCSWVFNASIFADKKDAPLIQMNPSDGIVCPYDSVEMWVPNNYVSYNWYGPEGDSLSLTSTHFDEDIGPYFCIVEDDEGCFLTSPSVEINEFTQPYFVLEPNNIYCGDPITITVVGDESLSVNWLSPLSGNNFTQTVNEAGWYYCEMQQCGLYFIDSVFIIDGTFTPFIQASDTSVCEGEQVTLSLDNSSYLGSWSNGDFGNSIQVTQSSNYSVEVVNSYGCVATSNTIQINFQSYPQIPQISDTVSCSGNDVVLSAAPYQVNWFTQDSIFLDYSEEYTLSNITQDTTLLYSLEVPNCDYQFQELEIIYISNNLAGSIIGTNQACFYDSVFLVANANGQDGIWLDENLNVVAADSSLFVSSFMGSTFYYIHSNACYSDTIQHVINWQVPGVVDLGVDSIYSCPFTWIELELDSLNTVEWYTNNGVIYGNELYGWSQNLAGMVVVHAFDSLKCALQSDSLWIIEHPVNFAYNVSDDGFCPGDSVSIELLGDLDSIQWSVGGGQINDSSLISVQIGTELEWVYVDALDSNSCPIADSIPISPFTIIDYVFPSDTILCNGESLLLPSDPNVDFSWVNDSLTEFVPIESGTYYYTVSSPDGCQFIDSIVVTLISCSETLPNVLTPNGDGLNDYLVIGDLSLFPNNRLEIMNRWDNPIFSAAPYQNNFSGQGLTDGVYFYIFYPDTSNGTDTQSQFLYILND